MSTCAPPAIDRLTATRRPAGRAMGYHRWSNLLFAHWRLPAELVRPLIPASLTLDTWEGDAWVGLVPFYMSRIRPWWAPPVPGISYFCETNVRTYVHLEGRDPGVWFFSLEASNSLAVCLARWRWHLPYFRAAMRLTREGHRIEYISQRHWPKPAGAECHILVHLDSVPPEGPATEEEKAVPGTLEHFLIERYILYSENRSGQLFAGHVHHVPYPLRPVHLEHLNETLIAAAGISAAGPPCHLAYSEGVDVEVFPLRKVSLPQKDKSALLDDPV